MAGDDGAKDHRIRLNREELDWLEKALRHMSTDHGGEVVTEGEVRSWGDIELHQLLRRLDSRFLGSARRW